MAEDNAAIAWASHLAIRHCLSQLHVDVTWSRRFTRESITTKQRLLTPFVFSKNIVVHAANTSHDNDVLGAKTLYYDELASIDFQALMADTHRDYQLVFDVIGSTFNFGQDLIDGALIAEDKIIDANSDYKTADVNAYVAGMQKASPGSGLGFGF